MANNGYKRTLSLNEIAEMAMIERGFISEFPVEVLQELAEINSPVNPPSESSHDMREFLWISIDNDDSKDLDQLTFAEKMDRNKYKIYVAVADVDGLVKKGSAIDKQASHNTTSVYTPTKVFPMLPLKLSTDLTSLNENKDRHAIVIEMLVDDHGQFELSDIYPARVRNHVKLAYNGVAAWLKKQDASSYPSSNIAGLPEQIRLQDLIAQNIKKYRDQQGALDFATIEVQPVVQDGVPVKLEEVKHNRAQELIENFMIAANVSMSQFLTDRKLPILRRIVRTPKRWDRIIDLANDLGTTLPPEPDVKALQAFIKSQRMSKPDQFADLSLAIIKLIGRGEYVAGFPGVPSPGHFDLAQINYAHTTAPNRRYPDVIMQRILKSSFEKKKNPYSDVELTALAEHCTLKEDDATKVERRVRKSAAAIVLAPQIGHQFTGMVTGAGSKGYWVRLDNPPIEGKIVQGFQGVDVGDKIRVRLIHVDINNGFIDFARI